MTPLAEVVVKPAHGLVVTSATLSDGSGDLEADWRAAERRTGADALARPAIRAQVPSPFDYPAHTRVFIVNDVRKDDMNQVAAAYRELFLAAGGGGLGLFDLLAQHLEQRVHRTDPMPPPREAGWRSRRCSAAAGRLPRAPRPAGCAMDSAGRRW